jgi:hypothetical protein
MPKAPQQPAFNTKSTKNHRNAMRATGMTEIFNSSVATFSFSAQIPIKFSQSLLMGFSLLSQDLKAHERAIESSQFILTTTQTIILIGLFLAGKEMLMTGTLISRVFALCDMLNKGILLVSWAPSELSKEDTPISPSTH